MTEAKKPQMPVKQNNALADSKKATFAAVIKSEAVQRSLSSTLGDMAKTKTFTASLISAVSTNKDLRDCDPMSVISSALLGESLSLSPSPQLGQYYIMPFNDNKAGIKKGTFVLGWKGYYQLALRSGQYKNIDAVCIKEGELLNYDPITGNIELKPMADPLERERAKTIGYYAFFELNNGFQKKLYWSKEQMEAHAGKYSRGYSAKKGYTFWEKDFDSMALKTMYRQLISKYGIMSIEMQTAMVNDMTIQPDITRGDEAPVYFDAGTGEVIEGEFTEVISDGKVA